MNKRLAAVVSGSFLALAFCVLPAWTQQTPAQTSPLPSTFDLRTKNAVTPVKNQIGGTCWTHGTMASIESNLLLSGKWAALGQPGIPKLSEYHLDWWNGFNKNYNEDVAGDPSKLATGMTVHQGGDYKVAAAYISRGDGVVIIPEGWNGQDVTAWSANTPAKSDPLYKKLYVRDIEFFTIGDNLERIDLIKKEIMKYGGMGTAYQSNGKYLSKNNVHYQPISSNGDPNHSVCIVGWDDNKLGDDDKKAPKPGAWLIKNSWGEGRGDKGYYWISFYDKHSARHPEMGAVSFHNVEKELYAHIYYLDAHGWRDTLPKISQAFNAFTVPAAGKGGGKGGAKGKGKGGNAPEMLKAISFITSQHNVNYEVKIYGKFENGKLDDLKASQSGKHEFCGFHTIDLEKPFAVKPGEKLYVYVDLKTGGQAIDRTSNIPVLLDDQPPVQNKAAAGQPPAKTDAQPPAKKDVQPQKKGGKGGGGQKPIVVSKANPGESFYFANDKWNDLYDYKFENVPAWATAAGGFDHTANFCIKILTVKGSTNKTAE